MVKALLLLVKEKRHKSEKVAGGGVLRTESEEDVGRVENVAGVTREGE